MKRYAAIPTMVLCAAMTSASPVAAQDVIGYWNQVTLTAVSQAAPGRSRRDSGSGHRPRDGASRDA